MPKVILKGYIVVPSEDLVAVQKELPNHIERTRQEKGCLFFDVSQDEGSINRFSVHEEFIDKKSFSDHQERVRNSKWGTVSKNIERHYHINEIE